MCCQLDRRDFIALAATGVIGGSSLLADSFTGTQQAEWEATMWDPQKPFATASKPLKVQPVLMYTLPTRREMNSWKSWGGIQTQQDVDAEVKRITEELKGLAGKAEFPVEVLPVIPVPNVQAAAATRDKGADVNVIYPATGSGNMLRACIPPNGNAVLFIRHRSGPVSYWYEALSVRYLKTDRPQKAPANPAQAPILSVHDVVVDDSSELLWRLRAFYGVKNFTGTKIVALGGAIGKYAADAAQVAREKLKLEIIEIPYSDFEKRIRSARNEPARVSLASRWAEKYLALPGTTLDTDKKFVVNAFVLYGVFKDLMRENAATAFSINQCMGTIMPMSETTACLPLSLLNDEGLMAFCESDYVIIPAGILMRYIVSKPVFLHNSTFPHNGVVTCAHCTAPRRMNGNRYEPVRILTHYESEFGAAPKIEMPKGQEVTFIDPEYATLRWVGLRGVVESNPFYPICRSQHEVRIQGNWKALLNEIRDSHWVMAYGNYMNEIGYAAPRIGATWEPVTEA